MGFLSILSQAHKLVEERVGEGDTTIDATVGNGVDTVFLAKLVGKDGAVFGFDIQPQALLRARERLYAENYEDGRVRLIPECHSGMAKHLPPPKTGNAAAVMFNLGYLPGGDHLTITAPQTTLPALEAAILAIRPGGIVTIVLYPGHAGGSEEAEAVMKWAAALPQNRYQVMRYEFINQKNSPPFLIAVERRGER